MKPTDDAAYLLMLTLKAQVYKEVIEILQERYKAIIEQLPAQEGDGALDPRRATARRVVDAQRKRLGQPKHLTSPGKRLSSGWPEDPEERSREMKRRQRVARAKREGRPRRGRPARAKSAQQKFWDALSPAQRKARIQAMLAGKGKPKKNGAAQIEAIAS